MDPQNTNNQNIQNQQDDPNAGFVPIGGPVGEGFVEIVPEVAPAAPEVLSTPEVFTQPMQPRNVTQDLGIPLPAQPVNPKTETPKIVNRATSKEHLHSVGKNADTTTKEADKEETDFIEKVEEHHKTD
jgi:hypothetical protein